MFLCKEKRNQLLWINRGRLDCCFFFLRNSLRWKKTLNLERDSARYDDGYSNSREEVAAAADAWCLLDEQLLTIETLTKDEDNDRQVF